MTVYLDLLILDNFCADAALLYCAVKTVRGEAKLWRIALTALLATALGVGYTVLCLYVVMPVPVDILVKYGVLLLLPCLALRAKRGRTYVFCSLAFAAYMTAFAGLLTALFSDARLAAQEGDALLYTVAGLPSGVLVGAAVLFGFLAARCGRALARRAKAAARLVTCTLRLGGGAVTVRALLDTGNKLCDARGRGVPVADPAAVRKLFALSGITDTGGEGREKWSAKGKAAGGADLALRGELAVTTVSGTCVLKTFRADAIEIYCAGRVHIIEDVTVALGARPLAGEYGLILPASFAEEEELGGGGR